MCDYANARLQFVKEDGTFLKSIRNGPGDMRNRFYKPTFIVQHPSGVLVVSEEDSKRLQFLQEDGTFLGSYSGGDWTGIAVLSDGSLVACNKATHQLDFLK